MKPCSTKPPNWRSPSIPHGSSFADPMIGTITHTKTVQYTQKAGTIDISPFRVFSVFRGFLPAARQFCFPSAPIGTHQLVAP
jgi:hypothetical protein